MAPPPGGEEGGTLLAQDPVPIGASSSNGSYTQGEASVAIKIEPVLETIEFKPEEHGLNTLEKLILDGIPYEYDEVEPELTLYQEVVTDPDTNQAVIDPGTGKEQVRSAPVLLEGQAKDKSEHGRNRLTKLDEEAMQGKPWLSHWWYFNAEPYRVTKAMWIAYTVKRDGKRQTRHILVGYTGVDPHG